MWRSVFFLDLIRYFADIILSFDLWVSSLHDTGENWTQNSQIGSRSCGFFWQKNPWILREFLQTFELHAFPGFSLPSREREREIAVCEAQNKEEWIFIIFLHFFVTSRSSGFSLSRSFTGFIAHHCLTLCISDIRFESFAIRKVANVN